MTSRSGKCNEAVLQEQSGGVGEYLLEEAHQHGVAEHVSATAGHFMDYFGDVHLLFTLLDGCGVHGLVLVTEQIVRDEVT